MNKYTLSVLTALAMSTTTYAAEDVTPSPFYLGLAYSYYDSSYGSTDVTTDGVLGLAGYNINDNFAIEGRYTETLSDLEIDGTDRDKIISNIAVYLKAMYPLDNFALYGLFGYGQTSANNESEKAPQYGAGLSYDLSNNFGLFLDWTNLYDYSGLNYPGDSSDYEINAWNFGATYNY